MKGACGHVIGHARAARPSASPHFDFFVHIVRDSALPAAHFEVLLVLLSGTAFDRALPVADFGLSAVDGLFVVFEALDAAIVPVVLAFAA